MNKQVFEGVLLEAGKLTSKTFKLYIPDRMTKDFKNEVLKSEPKSADEENVRYGKKLLNVEGVKKKNLKLRNYIEATSVTDYAIRMDGVNVFDMEKSEGVVSTETLPNTQDHLDKPDTPNQVAPLVIQGTGVGSNGGGPIATVVTINTPHSHKIAEPMMFYNMQMTNLHNKETKVGDKVIVTMLREHEFIVSHIKGYIPQDGDEVDNKWGE